MKNPINHSKETMWQATISCDSAYDGMFFYAVRTTGIFCRPSCKSKVPNCENVSFFPNATEAHDAGYRPCKRCRPDLNIKTYDPLESLVEDTKRLIKNNYVQNMPLHELASRVGVSRFHLNRIFKERTGYTPRIYLEMIRVNEAKELLLTTNLNSTEVGFQTGYQSVSSFYNAFKRNTGLSPSQFRSCHNRSLFNQEPD
ncbi:bifunctional transcriptional activator/DNA repair enzyme AdaA [Sediminibacillus albus]|uniref:AraC family transcriptional regulator, regulatory protein of adaptative response / methylphosphotriester-DNA alkyltransferase methyltransferase n=1 Tax=Sediminibacillus albus TaxID=407036 RepID=A0A1G8WLL5_9BACI|nr:bifunctional transcriptional activator/DNA repair enzyme AdaA [Sediminibacillus albus]SDJ79017.1 AraC family transcriptional regulator, regulatory protein of adaptative response / methylphosphotriester-DNA alkyltransferase methyltransferase [Sediminibacillus albus]